MNCLLVDDEPGIREGLAALLRRRGHVVRTATDVGSALDAVLGSRFDVVLTDWRLPDGVASPILAACGCPAIAVSGHPDEVERAPNVVEILTKPVGPRKILECMDGLAPESVTRKSAGPHPPADPLESLPLDTRACLEAGIALLGPSRCEIRDDGAFATLVCPVPDFSAAARLEPLGGDPRVFERDGEFTLEWRIYRDARPDGCAIVGARDAWPENGALAVDFDGCDGIDPTRFLDMVARARARSAGGGIVHFLNVPPRLRFSAEVSGKGRDMPKRTAPGPRIRGARSTLWS